MRIAVAGGLIVIAAVAGGIVMVQKGLLPRPTALADALGVTPAPKPPAPPAAAPTPPKPPADPVSTLADATPAAPPASAVPAASSAPPASTNAQGSGAAPPAAKPAGSVAAAGAAPPAPAAASTPAPAPAPKPVQLENCTNPNALGIGRVVQIDTTGGPGFGFEHFKTHDFLRPKEVVLTFDDGPWPNNTPAVLAALAAECTKATFFPIGEHATWHPEILKQVAAAGHTIGSHTWSHKDLSKLSLEDAKTEIEKGVSAVHWALGGPSASFIRFPALRHPPEVVSYVGQRNMAIFSCDLDSFDFKLKKPDAVIKSVMTKLDKLGKGIILMHDFQHATALALPELLRQLKAKGYTIVHMTSKAPLPTLKNFDDEIAQALGGPGMSAAESERPTKDIVQTISGQ